MFTQLFITTLRFGTCHLWNQTLSKNCCQFLPEQFWPVLNIVPVIRISFVNLHLLYKRATPEQFLLYRHALCIYQVLNSDVMTREWLELNFNQVFTSRQTKFITLKTNRRKVGLNALANRAFILNNKIPLEWINMSLNTFKVYCKKEFLI